MANAVAVFTPAQRFVDTAGVPISGATAEFYNASTSDPKTVYSDSGLTVPIGVVVFTDAAGYPVTASGGTTKTLVFTDTTPYKIVLKDGTGSIYATHDNCVGAVVAGSGGGGTGITQAQADVRYVRNPNALTASSGIADADIMPFWEIASAANKGITYANFKADIQVDLTALMKTAGTIFNPGDQAVFRMSTAPTGWTKNLTYNDHALRVVSGSLVDGGSTGFSVAFPAQTPSGTVSGTSVNTGQLAVHAHGYGSGSIVIDGGTTVGVVLSGGTAGANTGNQGSGASHAHSFTGNALSSFTPKYADVIFASKN